MKIPLKIGEKITINNSCTIGLLLCGKFGSIRILRWIINSCMHVMENDRDEQSALLSATLDSPTNVQLEQSFKCNEQSEMNFI